MGFDDLRPKARQYDSWGFIGTKHRAPEKPKSPSLVGQPCTQPGCSGRVVLGCGGCIHGDQGPEICPQCEPHDYACSVCHAPAEVSA